MRVLGNEMAVVCDNKTIVQPVVSSTVIYLVAAYGKALLSRSTLGDYEAVWKKRM